MQQKKVIKTKKFIGQKSFNTKKVVCKICKKTFTKKLTNQSVCLKDTNKYNSIIEKRKQKKRYEEKLAKLFDTYSIKYQREYALKFGGSSKRIDFFVEFDNKYIFIEMDEHHHKDENIIKDINKILYIIYNNKFINKNIHIIRVHYKNINNNLILKEINKQFSGCRLSFLNYKLNNILDEYKKFFYKKCFVRHKHIN